MKKLIIASVFILLTGTAFSQTLQKGSLIGIHDFTVTLDPDVTMNQYMDFLINTYVPEYEKSFQGVKLFVLKGIRGDHENGYALIFYFESVKDRDRYFKDEGGLNEVGQSAMNKLRPLLNELNKLGAFSTVYTDWVIQ